MKTTQQKKKTFFLIFHYVTYTQTGMIKYLIVQFEMARFSDMGKLC